jgi:hypothetical protein
VLRIDPLPGYEAVYPDGGGPGVSIALGED